MGGPEIIESPAFSAKPSIIGVGHETGAPRAGATDYQIRARLKKDREI